MSGIAYGQFYMRDNLTPTVIGVGSTDVWTKIVGVTTTDGSLNSNFTPSDNRLTYTDIVDKVFLSQATVSFTQDVPSSGPFVDFDVEVGLYDYDSLSGIGTILQSSLTTVKGTTYGKHYTVYLTDIHNHAQNDYVELYIRNRGTDCSIIVTDMCLLLTPVT
jgi:hypothetical protein